MTSISSEIQALIDTQTDAIRARDIDRLMSHFSDDVVYYDVVPPLQFAGSAALRERFLHWFDGYQGGINLEIRELHIMAGGDIAVAFRFSRAAGTLKNGRVVGSWVRATSVCRRSPNGWVIFHEHVSWPVDGMSGSAAKDLVP